MSPRKKTRRKKGELSPTLKLLPWLAVAVVALAAVLWLMFRGRSAGDQAPMEARLVELAAAREVASENIAADDPIRKVDGVFVRTWRIAFPTREDRDGFVGDVQLEGAERGAEVSLPEDLSGKEVRVGLGLGPEAFDLRLAVAAPRPTQPPPTPQPTRVPTATPRPQPPPGARGRLAILLDDGGQSMDLVPQAAALPSAVAVAILPFLPYSAETANAMYDAGHEIWLHLPMEPEGYPNENPGPGALLVEMPPKDLRRTVHSALNNIPHVVGVNNHMGSRATTDLRMMTWVMQELKARNMAFIDSRTTTRTVAEEAARAQGVPTNRRHVFLDNERTQAAIRSQLDEAVYRCRMEGEIIAIGHLAPETVQLLAKELPGLAKRGADLVPPSELVH
jgi:hypothetical protein